CPSISPACRPVRFRSPAPRDSRTADCWDRRTRAVARLRSPASCRDTACAWPAPRRSSVRTARTAVSGAARSRRTSRLRQREYVQHAPLGRVVGEVLGGADEPERAIRIARIEVACHHRARPAPDTREDGHVLAPVRAFIGDGLAVDAGADAELPQQLAGLGIHRLEPAIHGAVERDAMDRWFKAVDAKTGKLLWKFRVGSGINGQPI